MRNLLLIALFLWLPTAISAQCSLNGTVTDVTGEPLPGVSVLLQNPTDATAMVTATDADGFFMFNRLPKQAYTIEVEGKGFKKLSQKVEVTGRTSADLEMKSNCWYYWIRFKKCRT